MTVVTRSFSSFGTPLPGAASTRFGDSRPAISTVGRDCSPEPPRPTWWNRSSQSEALVPSDGFGNE